MTVSAASFRGTAAPVTDLNPLPSKLDAVGVKRFRRDGFLQIDDFLGADEVEPLRVIYDGLFTDRTGTADGNFCQSENGGNGGGSRLQISHCSKYRPELKETRLYHDALAVARQLLGSKAVFWGDFALLKPSRHGGPTPWHQDEAYWSPDLKYDHMAVWVPLQEATVENGCMQFIPRSHQRGIVEHRPRAGGECASIEACGVDETQAVACPLRVGGVTLHHCRTLHYTGPNQSTGPRRAYILNFGVPTRYRRFFRRKFAWRTEPK